MIDVEKLAREAGINTKFWNMGAGSVLFVSFVDGIPRSNFEEYTAMVLEQAAQKCDESCGGFNWASENADQYHAQDHRAKQNAAAIRAMKPEAK